MVKRISVQCIWVLKFRIRMWESQLQHKKELQFASRPYRLLQTTSRAWRHFQYTLFTSIILKIQLLKGYQFGPFLRIKSHTTIGLHIHAQMYANINTVQRRAGNWNPLASLTAKFRFNTETSLSPIEVLCYADRVLLNFFPQTKPI